MSPSARKALDRLSRTDTERVVAALRRLPAGDVIRLQSGGGVYRLRVGRLIRVIFLRDDSLHRISVLDIRSRGSAYKP